MTAYSTLKTRIATEMVRDDIGDGEELEGTLDTHFEQACEYYADEKFWFNSLIATTTTSNGTINVALPAAFRRIDRVTIPAYDLELVPTVIDDFEDYSTNALPSHWTWYNDNIRLYPTPDATYTLRLYGIAQIDAPSDDADENIWTTEAQHLIVAHTKMTLARDVFRDPEGAQMFLGAALDQLRKLRRETARRLTVPLRALPGGRRYNINTG